MVFKDFTTYDPYPALTLASQQALSNVNEFTGLKFEEFWDRCATGRPRTKHGITSAVLDYEKALLQDLDQHRHIWIKKATGLGIIEFFLRYIGWICTRDNQLQGAQICIVTGPRIELAITLIRRLKDLFPPSWGLQEQRDTVAEINGCRIEAFPSHHLDTMRGLPNVKFIFLDEADFFPPGQQKDARDVAERYIAKSDPYIVMVSTPNLPAQSLAL